MFALPSPLMPLLASLVGNDFVSQAALAPFHSRLLAGTAHSARTLTLTLNLTLTLTPKLTVGLTLSLRLTLTLTLTLGAPLYDGPSGAGPLIVWEQVGGRVRRVAAP